MEYFLSCDWGTSAFRLRLVAVTGLKVVAEDVSEVGIAGTYQRWRESQENERINFYLGVISEHIQKLGKRLDMDLDQVPVVISGMASSSIGMLELPYQELPFALNGSDVGTQYLEATAGFPHPVLLISGVKSDHDVMRGEEAQLIGLVTEQPAAEQEQIYIFPGTHSKHIRVKGNQAVAFKTYMTGEFFALLTQESILKSNVLPVQDSEDPALQGSFIKGVKDAVGANLLHAAFRVRTNHLFDLFNPSENFNYLSGLIIGTELQDLQDKNTRINLVAGKQLQKYYTLALQTLGHRDRLHIFPARWVDEAVVRGQYKIYQSLIK